MKPKNDCISKTEELDKLCERWFIRGFLQGMDNKEAKPNIKNICAKIQWAWGY